MERKLAFVFAGCGGTFWTASPMLSALVRKYGPDLCVFVDPDRLEVENLERQWVAHNSGQPKATLGALSVCGEDGGELPMPLAGVVVGKFPTEIQELDGRDVVVITNVDNNRGRLEIREWCKFREGFAGMVVSGCDQDFGQVWWGAWKDRGCIHDWLPGHPDVRKNGVPPDTCGQNILSNATTGVFLGYGLRDVMEHLWADWNGRELERKAREYYWKERENGVRAWTDEVELERDEE